MNRFKPLKEVVALRVARALSEMATAAQALKAQDDDLEAHRSDLDLEASTVDAEASGMVLSRYQNWHQQEANRINRRRDRALAECEIARRNLAKCFGQSQALDQVSDQFETAKKASVMRRNERDGLPPDT